MRDHPFGAFNYAVAFNGVTINGGFSDVSGLGTELNVTEYREGIDKGNHTRQVPLTFKTNRVTCKRGVVDSNDVWNWIKNAHQNGLAAKIPSVTITLRDEAGNDIQSWVLQNVLPSKYVGPTFAAKGDGDVAMEELELVADSIDFKVPS